jgi:hypothetical protein
MELTAPFAVTLYKPTFPWNNPQHRSAWTLEEMLKSFQISDFYTLLKSLRKLESEVELSIAECGLPYEKVCQSWSQYTVRTDEILKQIIHLCSEQGLNLKGSLNRAVLLAVLSEEKTTLALVELHSRLRDLRENLEDELKGHVFLYLPPVALRLYFEKVALFGEEVQSAFPHASIDVKEAGNCYALELYTASVFHLMRVLEHGLRALAQYVGVPYNRECWGRIIDDIERKLAEPDPSPRTPEKADRHRFCAQAALEFGYFKDAWRNYTMHLWDYYHQEAAAKVMEHVKDFMKHLSVRLSENP